jgi:hypothetical protein
MQYFNTLPKLVKIDKTGNAILLTNLLTRASVLSGFLNNPAVYYTYDIQDGDTPEIIAHKYYGDVYRYWIVLFANQIIDPQWQWPLSSKNLDVYIVNKYMSVATNGQYTPSIANTSNTNIYSQVISYVQSTIKQFQKIIITTDNTTNIQTTKVIGIDSTGVSAVIPNTQTVTFPDGSSCVVSTSINALSYYNYEIQQNENNRNIKIINSSYVTELEKELQTLMKQ